MKEYNYVVWVMFSLSDEYHQGSLVWVMSNVRNGTVVCQVLDVFLF